MNDKQVYDQPVTRPLWPLVTLFAAAVCVGALGWWSLRDAEGDADKPIDDVVANTVIVDELEGGDGPARGEGTSTTAAATTTTMPDTAEVAIDEGDEVTVVDSSNGEVIVDESDLVIEDNYEYQSPLADGTAMGRISIPAIGTEWGVVSGVTDAQLAQGGYAHHPTSFVPTAGGSVLACHRTTHGGPCRDMDQLAEGDEITYTDESGVPYRYRVAKIDVVTAEDAAELVAPTVADLITIYTCSDAEGNPGSVSHRLVVRAVPA